MVQMGLPLIRSARAPIICSCSQKVGSGAEEVAETLGLPGNPHPLLRMLDRLIQGDAAAGERPAQATAMRPPRLIWKNVGISAMVTAMSTDRKTVDFIVDQATGAGSVSARPMFGEYGLYLNGKMVAIIADDNLYLKPTSAGRALANGCAEESPYPGAKAHLLIDADRWDDRDWFADLLRRSADELPAPKSKTPKASKRPG